MTHKANGLVDFDTHGEAHSELFWWTRIDIAAGEVKTYEMHVDTSKMLILSPFAYDELIVGIVGPDFGGVSSPVFWY